MNYRMLQDIFAARRYAFLFLGVLTLLAAGGYLYLSYWQRPQLEKAQSDWFAKREALASGETVADATRYRNALRDLAALDGRLVPKREFAAFVSKLYETAGDNSLTLTGINYSPGRTKEKGGPEGILPYGVSFSVSGRYASVKSFIADLVRYREIATVDSLALSSKKQTEEEVGLQVQMTVYLKTEGA